MSTLTDKYTQVAHMSMAVAGHVLVSHLAPILCTCHYYFAICRDCAIVVTRTEDRVWMQDWTCIIIAFPVRSSRDGGPSCKCCCAESLAGVSLSWISICVYPVYLDVLSLSCTLSCGNESFIVLGIVSLGAKQSDEMCCNRHLLCEPCWASQPSLWPQITSGHMLTSELHHCSQGGVIALHTHSNVLYNVLWQI